MRVPFTRPLYALGTDPGGSTSTPLPSKVAKRQLLPSMSFAPSFANPQVTKSTPPENVHENVTEWPTIPVTFSLTYGVLNLTAAA